MLKMKFVAKIRNFVRFQIKSIRAFIREDDYQNEDGSYKYKAKAKRRSAFLKS